MKTVTKRTIALLLFLLLPTSLLRAQGILFSEYRMILQGNEVRSLQVCNPTEEQRSFSLSFIDKTMEEGGKIVDVPDSVALASSLRRALRVFPRRITLLPGECQEVQLQLRSSSSLGEGEYRSYLHFQPLLSETEEPEPDPDVQGPVPVIIIRIGAAIPVIFRKEVKLQAIAIDSVGIEQLDDSTRRVWVRMQRTGNKSTYGPIHISGLSKGKPLTLAKSPDQAIYTETRMKLIPIDIPIQELDVNPSGKSSFIITYLNGETKGKQEPLAEWEGEL